MNLSGIQPIWVRNRTKSVYYTILRVEKRIKPLIFWTVNLNEFLPYIHMMELNENATITYIFAP